MILPAIETQTEIQPGTQMTAKQGASSASGELENEGALSFEAKLREATQLQGAGPELVPLAEENDARATGLTSGGQGRSGSSSVQSGGTAFVKSTVSGPSSGEVVSAGADYAGTKSSAVGGQSADGGGKSTMVAAEAASLSGTQTGGAKAELTVAGDPAGTTPAEQKSYAEIGLQIASGAAAGYGAVDVPVLGVETPVAREPGVAAWETPRAAASGTAALPTGASKNAGARALGASARSSAPSASAGRTSPTTGPLTVAASGLMANHLIDGWAASGTAPVAQQGHREGELDAVPQNSTGSGISAASGRGSSAPSGVAVPVSTGATAETLGGVPVVASAKATIAAPAVAAANSGAKPATRIKTADAKGGSGTTANAPAAAKISDTADAVPFASLPVGGPAATHVEAGPLVAAEVSGSARVADLTQATISRSGEKAGQTTAGATDREAATLIARAGGETGTALLGLGGTIGTGTTETAGSSSATASAALRDEKAAGGPGFPKIAEAAQKNAADASTEAADKIQDAAVSNALRAAEDAAGGLPNTVGAGSKVSAGKRQAGAAPLRPGTATGTVGTDPQEGPSGGRAIDPGREAARDGVGDETSPIDARSKNESWAEANPGVDLQSTAASEARADRASASTASGARSVALNAAGNASNAATLNSATANAADAAGASANSSAHDFGFGTGPGFATPDSAIAVTGASSGHAPTALPAGNALSEVTAGSVAAAAHGAGAMGAREAGAAASAASVSAGSGATSVGDVNGAAVGGLSSVSHGETTVFAEPHRTLLATPTALEVGVPNGTQGWVKIRAEVGGEGQVNASLAAGSSASQELLHRQLPALNAYLHSEQMSVTTTVAERSFGGDRSGTGSGAGEAGHFQPSGGGANAGGSSNGSSNPAVTNAGGQAGGARDEPRTESVSGLASSYDGRAGMDAAPDAGLSAALGGTSGGARAGALIETGQWLNVRA